MGTTGAAPHPDSVIRTLQLHRTTVLRLLSARVERLAERFSQSEHRLFVSPALDASLQSDSEEMPDVASSLKAVGAEPAPMPPDAFAAFTRGERAKWKEVVRIAGVRVD